VWALASKCPCRLASSSVGNVFTRIRHGNRYAEDACRDDADRFGRGSPTDESNSGKLSTLLNERIQCVGETTEHAFDTRAGEVGGSHVVVGHAK
jgi:hypothetical protein